MHKVFSELFSPVSNPARRFERISLEEKNIDMETSLQSCFTALYLLPRLPHFWKAVEDIKKQQTSLHCWPELALGQPRIRGSLCVCVCVCVCLDRNRTL